MYITVNHDRQDIVKKDLKKNMITYFLIILIIPIYTYNLPSMEMQKENSILLSVSISITETDAKFQREIRQNLLSFHQNHGSVKYF